MGHTTFMRICIMYVHYAACNYCIVYLLALPLVFLIAKGQQMQNITLVLSSHFYISSHFCLSTTIRVHSRILKSVYCH